MARPVVFLIAGVVVLGDLGSFYFQLNRGSSTDVNQLPDVPSKQAFLTLQREFAGGLADPVRSSITGDVQSPAGAGGDRARSSRRSQANPAFSRADVR